LTSIEENSTPSATESPPEPEYAVASAGVKESHQPLRERFDLLVEVAAPFAALPLTKENIKAVKTAFILKNSEQAKHSRFPLPSTDEIRKAVGVLKVVRACDVLRMRRSFFMLL
jgi:hypothetical protein